MERDKGIANGAIVWAWALLGVVTMMIGLIGMLSCLVDGEGYFGLQYIKFGYFFIGLLVAGGLSLVTSLMTAIILSH